MPETPTPDELAREAKRRQLAYNASFLPNPERERQGEAASWTLKKRVHDIIETETEDGDGLLIWVFVKLNVGTTMQRDLEYDDDVVLMIVYLEQERQHIRFYHATWSREGYVGKNGENMIKEAQAGRFM